jgi:hypothetical protein
MALEIPHQQYKEQNDRKHTNPEVVPGSIRAAT